MTFMDFGHYVIIRAFSCVAILFWSSERAKGEI
jgi:hypothetical protein